MGVFVSLDFLRGRLPSYLLEELALFLGLCFECGGCLRNVDGEVVCERCGRVWGYENVDESVPFPEYEKNEGNSHFEGHWQPGSSLCFLKGLGDPALENNGRGRGLMRVLAMAPAKGEDLGLRARRIKVMVQAEDPPQLRRILSRISQLLDKLGFRGNHEVAAYTGNLARKIVAFAIAARIKVPSTWADAIVHHTLNKLQLKATPNQVLKHRDRDLQFVEWFQEAMRKIKLEEIRE
ncbi:MAG: TFIIB-type zinc ribbon-containing protein [Candidatus Bathyarchaeia archaeon]